MPQTLLDSPRYSKFIGDRDRALEQMNINAQTDLSRLTHAVLSQIENLAASAALKAHASHLTHHLTLQFETGTREIFTQAFPLFVRRIQRLRRAAFVLSYAGEQEAIGRATKRRIPVSRGKFNTRLQAAMAKPTLLGPLDKRIWLALMNLRRRIVQAFELALTQELPAAEIVDKVKAAFPPRQVYKRPPKALVKAREAYRDPDEENRDWFDFDFIEDGDWDLAVSAYKDTELPPDRFDRAPGYDPDTGTMRYQWEMEQESTEDFVSAVRGGQVDGAEDLGVKEFVWIAVIDNHTCDDCCLPRNGKTTSEIEAMQDDCDATVPPAHFNCRCNIGPVASTDEVQGPDWSSFNDWLEPKDG